MTPRGARALLEHAPRSPRPRAPVHWLVHVLTTAPPGCVAMRSSVVGVAVPLGDGGDDAEDQEVVW